MPVIAVSPPSALYIPAAVAVTALLAQTVIEQRNQFPVMYGIGSQRATIGYIGLAVVLATAPVVKLNHAA